MRRGGSLVNKTADQVMVAIKKLAVRTENIMENITPNKTGMSQSGILHQDSAARTDCAVDINYFEQVLRDIITHGLADHEIQLDLLGDRNLTKTSAYTKTCGHCGCPNHIEAVCQQKAKPKPKLQQAEKDNIYP